MIKYGVELGEWKTAEQAAEEMVAEAQGEQDKASVTINAQLSSCRKAPKHKDEYFTRATTKSARCSPLPNMPAQYFSMEKECSRN